MSTEQDKVLKREDELRDISEIPEVQQGKFAPEKPGLFSKVKQGMSDLSSKITHHGDQLKENVLPQQHTETTTEHPKTLFGLINTGLSGLASGISHTIHSVTGHHETERPLAEKSENAGNLASVVTQAGGIDTEVRLAQELETKPEEAPVQKIARKMSRAMDDIKDSGVITHENTITPNREGPSTLDKINEQYGKVADKIVDTFDQIKDKILPGEARTESNITERGEDSDSTATFNEEREHLTKLIEAPTHQINPAELKEFHDVKTGFHETVDEFKHEQRVEELGGKEELVSANPFAALDKEDDLPEDDNRLFGDITNKTRETQPTETKTLAQVVKEGLTDVTATLSSTLGVATDKAISTLQTPEDKENFRQIA